MVKPYTMKDFMDMDKHLAVRCKEKEDLVALLNACDEMGIRWRTGGRANAPSMFPPDGAIVTCTYQPIFHSRELSYWEASDDMSPAEVGEHMNVITFDELDVTVNEEDKGPFNKQRTVEDGLFTMEEFKHEQMAVVCENKEELNDFLAICERIGLCWRGGDSATTAPPTLRPYMPIANNYLTDGLSFWSLSTPQDVANMGIRVVWFRNLQNKDSKKSKKNKKDKGA